MNRTTRKNNLGSSTAAEIRILSNLAMATQTVPTESPVIRAAGGIIQRISERCDEVMIVFRKQHQDWTLPKGEVRDGESFQEAALREALEETGCECRLGNYMGTISYSDQGTPTVVMFWKMTVMEEGTPSDTDEIGEVLWLPMSEAIQKLTHSQEKALLSRAGAAPRPPQTLPVTPEPAPAPALAREEEVVVSPAPQSMASAAAAPITTTPQQVPRTSSPAAEPDAATGTPSARSESAAAALPSPAQASSPRSKKSSATDDSRVHARLLRESEAFRVELAFLERRNGQSADSWSAAAHDQLDNVVRCLDSNDIEGGMLCLHAAQRYAVYGLNKTELSARAYILREEAARISSWRGEAMEGLLSVADDELTPEGVIDAMALRDQETTNQYYKTRLTGDHLRILLIICSLAVVALLPFMLLTGPARMVAPVLLFGLLGASFSAAHSLMRGRNESRIPNVFVMLTPVLFGAVAGLAGYAIYEYAAWVLQISSPHIGGVLGLAFLFGMLGQRVLSRLAAPKRRKKAKAVKA